MFAHGRCGHLGEVKFISGYSARLTRMDSFLFIRLKTTPQVIGLMPYDAVMHKFEETSIIVDKAAH